MDYVAYRRSEMELALWHAFSRHGADDDRYRFPPPIFTNRIKRLLDLERDWQYEVFTDRGTGRGHFAEYEDYHIFCVALALTYLDAGLTMADALYTLAHIQGTLYDVYQRIHASPPTLDMQAIAAGDRPNSPTQPDRPMLADTSVFLLICKVEMEECWPFVEPADDDRPFILGPVYCFGITELSAKLRTMDYQRPSWLVTEIAELAVLVRRHLARDKLSAALSAARLRRREAEQMETQPNRKAGIRKIRIEGNKRRPPK